MTPDEQNEDSLRDAIALVECLRRDDPRGVSVIVGNSSWMHVMLQLAKLAGEFCDEEDVSPDYWRRWADQAARRRSLRHGPPVCTVRYALAWK